MSSPLRPHLLVPFVVSIILTVGLVAICASGQTSATPADLQASTAALAGYDYILSRTPDGWQVRAVLGTWAS